MLVSFEPRAGNSSRERVNFTATMQQALGDYLAYQAIVPDNAIQQKARNPFRRLRYLIYANSPAHNYFMQLALCLLAYLRSVAQWICSEQLNMYFPHL